MNFLAHLYLSCGNEDLLLGNFIADFLRNKDVEHYSLEVQKGIQLHREIDSYTDRHPMVRKGTHRLQPHHHKYSPVVIDILYDYLLCQNWNRYSSQSLSNFAQEMYTILLSRIREMPPKLQKQLPGMINANWLVKYSQEEGIRYTFERMNKRTKFPSKFELAFDHLLIDYEDYNSEFNHFFPEVIAHVDQFCACD